MAARKCTQHTDKDATLAAAYARAHETLGADRSNVSGVRSARHNLVTISLKPPCSPIRPNLTHGDWANLLTNLLL